MASDSDSAGCLRTTKSTGGGVMCLGSCMMKHWSSTQKGIALSSVEAALYSATRALSEAKGLQCLAMDFGEDLRIRAHVDDQATIGLNHRARWGRPATQRPPNSGSRTPLSVKSSCWSRFRGGLVLPRSLVGRARVCCVLCDVSTPSTEPVCPAWGTRRRAERLALA